jgi:fructokinase
MTEFDIVCLGELLIDMFPGQVGKKLSEVEAFYPKPGGAPANVAVACSRLGMQSAFIGKVGQDHFGTYLAGILEKEGVNFDGLQFDPEFRTTLAIIAQPTIESAEYIFYRNPGADQQLTPAELDRSILQAAKIFHFGSLSLTDEPSRSATQEAIQIAADAGAMISCDVNYRPALWNDPQQAVTSLEEVLSEVDLLKVNEREANLLSGNKDDKADLEIDLEQVAAALLAKGPGLVVISLGKKGSYFQRKGYEGAFVKSYQVDSVDSVGCGDAFMAGLLTQIRSRIAAGPDLDNEFLQDALQFANAAGALTSMKQGAIPAMPRVEEVKEFLSLRTGEAS